MNFKTLTAKYFSGNLTDDLTEVAIVGLKQGWDSPSLIVLAGLNKADDFFEKEKYFKLSINELGLIIPDLRTACIEYALALAEEIINGQRDIIQGVTEIYQKAIMSYDFYSENKVYVYDSVFFEKVYGIYDEYDDFKDTWIDDKNSQKRIAKEIKERLLTALIEWRDKLISEQL